MKIVENAPLKACNTFGIEVSARRLVLIESDEELHALPDLGRHLLVGCGSDLVFTRDYEGAVVRLAVPDGAAPEVEDGCLRAPAGMVMDDLVAWCLAHGWYGLENLSGIPGTVGAGVVQNVGAYGVEDGDVVHRVRVYDTASRTFRWLDRSECGFAYRGSRFKAEAGRWVVAEVEFALQRRFAPQLRYRALETLPHTTATQLREAILDLRWSKLPRPEEYGSAGSFFKNPVVERTAYEALRSRYPDMPEGHAAATAADGQPSAYKISAAWLIDRAGWKGRSMGRAGVWPHQPLVLYNLGGCTGAEVVALAGAIAADVQRKFGVGLQPEAIIV